MRLSPERVIAPQGPNYYRVIMLQKCANPACSAKFHNLRDGRLFVMEVRLRSERQRLNYSWLCNSCSRTLTVVANKVQPRQPALTKAG